MQPSAEPVGASYEITFSIAFLAALTNRNFFQAGRAVVLLKYYGRSGWAESLDLLHIARRSQIKYVYLVAYYIYIIIYNTIFGNFSVVKYVK